MLRPSRLAVVLVLAVLAGLLVHGALVLPERVASHFELGGRPDGWTSRGQFLVLFGVLIGVVALLGFGLPALMRRAPDSLLNLPHREAWLAPERREATLWTLTDELRWLAVLTGALMGVLMERTIAFNLDPEAEALRGTGWFVGAYFLAVALWTVRLVRRFGRPPEDA